MVIRLHGSVVVVTVICVACASIAFSSSSLMSDAGERIISPAAIREMRVGGSGWIWWGIFSVLCEKGRVGGWESRWYGGWVNCFGMGGW